MTHNKHVLLFQDIIDLLCGPKLINPMWLSLLNGSSRTEQDELCSILVNSLTSALSLYDTKQTNL